jgi:hypothetical protein
MPGFPKHKHLHHPRLQVNTGRRKLDLSHLPEDESFDDWLAPNAAKNWIADAQITPDCLATKEQCSVYLSEYVQGTAISDTRMVEDDEEQYRGKAWRSHCIHSPLRESRAQRGEGGRHGNA